MTRSLCVVLMLLLSSAAQAATYYVSTTGNNSNNGLTIDTPWLTINKAVDTMVAGDTTYVRGGTYTLTAVIRFSRPGTEAAPIKLLNYPNERPIIRYPGGASASILIQHGTSYRLAMGYITIEGFEITEGFEGIKYYNLHNSVIQRNWIHDNSPNMGVSGGGGHHVLFNRNIINHNGGFASCSADPDFCNQSHGMYLHGQFYTITKNLIYDNLAYGIQQNGSSSSVYSTSKHPSVDFSGASGWVISDNLFAYEHHRAGLVVWGSLSKDARIENNIFFENGSALSSGSAQGIACTSCSGATGVSIRNNHFYASSSGAQAYKGTGFSGDLVESGNVVNVSAPAFVAGGANSLPASPDFRVTATAPIGIARINEYLNTATLAVGPFKTTPAPTASIHGKTVTLTFASATPIQVPSSAGISIGCTGSNCPGAPTVGSATKKTGTDTQVEVEINGISGNACVATNQTWTISYSSSSGSWTSTDDIGPYPGLHQKLFSFTNLAVTNLCDGTAPGGGVGTPIIVYDLNEGAGTTATNTGSTGSADNGTLANGATWTTGKTGTGVNITGGTQQVQVPYTPGNPTTSSQTWVLAVNVPAGGTSATRFDLGTQIGTNQRLYVGAYQGTWRVATQSTSLTASAASNLTVTEGWQHLCLSINAGTDTVTLYKNGVAGTGGATRAVTSFMPPSDILLGITGPGFPAAMAPGVYDDFLLYESVEDCTALHNDWNAPAVAVGTFGMPSYRFQSVYLTELGGSPVSFGTAINQAKGVVAGGAVAVMLEVHCENVADCEQDSFRLEARQNGTGSSIQVPDSETDTHIWLWGADNNTLLNSGATSSRLSAGSCTVTSGVTVVASVQVPVVDLPQDGCVVLRYIVRLGCLASGYYDLRLSQQNGIAFTGTVNPARINVVPMQAGVK